MKSNRILGMGRRAYQYLDAEVMMYLYKQSGNARKYAQSAWNCNCNAFQSRLARNACEFQAGWNGSAFQITNYCKCSYFEILQLWFPFVYYFDFIPCSVLFIYASLLTFTHGFLVNSHRSRMWIAVQVMFTWNLHNPQNIFFLISSHYAIHITLMFVRFKRQGDPIFWGVRKCESKTGNFRPYDIAICRLVSRPPGVVSDGRNVPPLQGFLGSANRVWNGKACQPTAEPTADRSSAFASLLSQSIRTNFTATSAVNER